MFFPLPFRRNPAKIGIISGGTVIPRIRFNWKKSQRKRLRQLIRRISVLASFLLIILALEIGMNSTKLQNNLSRQAFQEISEITSRTVNNLYQPLVNSLSLSSFWVKLGQIEDLGDPVLYADDLLAMMGQNQILRSLSLVDGDGQSLDMTWDQDRNASWQITPSDQTDSLFRQRYTSGLSFMNLDEKMESETASLINKSFRLSTPYKLPGTDMDGITLYYRIFSAPDKYLQVWMDIPLIRLAEMLSEYSINSDTVIFLLLNDKEYTLFPLDDIISYTRQKGTPFDTNFTGSIRDQKVLREIDTLRKDMGDKPTGVMRFEIDGEALWSHYTTLSIFNSQVIMGSYTPEASLLTTRIRNPLQIASLIFLFLILVYLFFLIDDFRRAAEPEAALSEEEKARSLIGGGETLHCEFKSSLRWDYKEEKANKALEGVIMKSIAAFSNSDGGTLFIGVKDDGSLLGLDPDYYCLKEPGRDYFELHLRTLLSNMYGVAYPVSHIKVRFPVIDSIEVCRIDILKGSEPLYTVSNEKGNGKTEKFYVRSGNSSRQITSVREITDYIMERFA